MPTVKVDLECQVLYAGLPLGPGKGIEVSPEQRDWLASEGHLAFAAPAEPVHRAPDRVLLGLEGIAPPDQG